jgi:hypothetical protein
MTPGSTGWLPGPPLMDWSMPPVTKMLAGLAHEIHVVLGGALMAVLTVGRSK